MENKEEHKLELYDREEFKKYDGILDYIKRVNYMYILITELDNHTNFEIIHSSYESQAIEKINLTGKKVVRVIIMNLYGECAYVKPDFIGNELKFKYDTIVDFEINSDKIVKDYKYITILKEEVMFLEFKVEHELKEKLLKEKDKVKRAFKLDNKGRLSEVSYGFKDYTIEIRKSRNWMREMRQAKRLDREEFRRDRREQRSKR